METTILRDDFTGSGTLEGHAANVNTLGAGGVWSSTGNAELSGGYLQCPATGQASGTMFGDGAAAVGLAMRHTWRWKPAGDRADYEQSNVVYPLGINFGAATCWVTNKATGCEMRLTAAGETGPSQIQVVTFDADTWYDGELIVANGEQTLTFLGHTLATGDEFTPEQLLLSLYLNMNTLPDGTTAQLDYIQSEAIEAPLFWTRHVGTREIQS